MRKSGILLTIALLLALVPAVLAGGWAVITLDDMPGDIHAGQPWTVGFMVLQHGQTPVHDLGQGYPIEPKLTATNAATGERVEGIATPTKELGHFVVTVTFPSEGEWAWTIDPVRLASETAFEPLTVLPPVAVAPVKQPVEAAASSSPASPATNDGFALASFLRWGALLVALAAVALLVVQNRRARPEPGVEPRS